MGCCVSSAAPGGGAGAGDYGAAHGPGGSAQLKHNVTSKAFEAFAAKMAKEGCSDAAIAAFRRNYEQLTAGGSGLLGEADVAPVKSLPRLEEIRGAKGDVGKLLDKTAVLKLNGGLGTGMGLEKAKSLLVVKDGHTFLDLIALQVKHMRKQHRSQVKFVLMNSFSTSEDTRAYLSKDHADLVAEPFFELMQNKAPKVDKVSLAPAEWAANPGNEWCPPGHGDIYAALAGSGMLDDLLGAGVEYLFVSNSDNLGATLDVDLLKYFAASGKSFVMEVAERTAADKKGGHLCTDVTTGGLMLRESAQCPPEDEDAFQDVSKYQFFNTNNLWVSLPKLKEAMEANGGALPLPVIKNEKTVDPRDKKSPKVLQLETAMGAAIQVFSDSGAVVVPRTRFAPVKTCGDLLTLRSDAYKVTRDHRIELDVKKPPVVKLDDAHYKMVDQLEALVDHYPSLKRCDKLTVKGPCKFVKGTTVEGETTITNESGEVKEVPAKKLKGTFTL